MEIQKLSCLNSFVELPRHILELHFAFCLYTQLHIVIREYTHVNSQEYIIIHLI